MAKYDYLIVGAGLFGAAFTQRVIEAGKSCLVLDRRPHIGGNCYTENIEGIEVHKYGPHIFHTNNKDVWQYVNRFAEYNRFTNSPLGNYHGELFNLPFNMNTFLRMWGVTKPAEARAKIEEQRKTRYTENPMNLEEQAINLVGTDIYEKLIQGYTEKQWGRPCRELPPEIITRLPVRFTYDNDYFTTEFQGVPKNGYTAMIAAMLELADIRLNADYLQNRGYWDAQAGKTLYTGAIDAFFDYRFGALEYRCLRFETEILPIENYQGVAVMNYTDIETTYTRVIEHKHFMSDMPALELPHTIISREYSAQWRPGQEAHYPINDAKNAHIYARYRALADKEKRVIFGGRLADYAYLDMDKIIEKALQLAEQSLLGQSLLVDENSASC